jgi:co-chaperonin GroES (HSP10)
MLDYNITKATFNHVVVKVDQSLDDTYTYKTLTVDIDPEFNPTQYARIYGTVVAVPQGSCYDEEQSEIKKEVEVGDKVYFHYLVTSSDTWNIYGNYYKVPYCWIFCSVRDSVIRPIGSWTLCEPIPEQELNQIEVDGIKIDAAVSQSGLITSLSKKPSVDYAKLRHIGSPLLNETPLDIPVNSTVILAKNSNFVNRIENVDYYTVKQRYILGVWESVS